MNEENQNGERKLNKTPPDKIKLTPPPEPIKIQNSTNNFINLLKDIQADTLVKAKPTVIKEKPTTTVDAEIQKQRARTEEVKNDKLQADVDKLLAENENLRNDQKLKSRTLILLFILFFLETAIVFLLSFLQGFHTWKFDLDLVTFRIVIVATLLQISAMLTIAVRHLFPTKKG